MMNGWRRAFCTSLPKERDAGGDSPDNHRRRTKPTSRFGFFSNPSTPQSETRPVSGSSLRCRTWAAAAVATPSPPPYKSPVSLLSLSSSPSSPASFSLLKSKVGFIKSSIRCGICSQSMKAGEGKGIFTAECSHSFHFPCVASRADNPKPLAECPVCGASWREATILPLSASLHELGSENSQSTTREAKNKSLRVYNDDEPLISSPISLAGFNPIPESDENDDDDDEQQQNGEFKGFFVNTASPLTAKLQTDPASRNVDVKLSPESAIVAASRGYQTYSVVMKVKSPPFPAARGMAHRAPVDLVTVLDMSGSIVGGKIEALLKRAMRVVISSLREADRLSIVAFSSCSKRMSPLRRMTASGRRSARRIVEALVGAGKGMSVKDALKKAAKVVEDRRQKNLFASIFVLTSRHNGQAHQAQSHGNTLPLVVSSTRFSPLEIPVHTIWLDGVGAWPEDVFAKRVNGLLSLSVQNLTVELGLASQGEITSVYSLSGRPGWLGSGSTRFGDMYADEEREVLVEIKAPAMDGPHRIMTVRTRYVDPTTQEVRSPEELELLIPRPLAVRSSSPSIISRLRNIHVIRRAVAESRRLSEREDYAGAERMLTSARAQLVQYGVSSGDACLRELDAELAELKRARGRHVACKGSGQVAQKAEPLTPTSAWRAAERLAKVAIMRKHMKRVSDLHGFDNARF